MIKRITEACPRTEQKKKPVDHKKKLETCNDVRLQICQKMINAAKTTEDRIRAELLEKKARQDRILIPITIVKRALYFGKE